MSAPNTLEGVPSELRAELRERLEGLRHDLGKYVVFQLRWLPPEPSDGELREALEADLARTRSGGGLVESAPQLWARLRPPLVGERPLADGSWVDLSSDPDLVALDRAIAAIQLTLAELASAHYAGSPDRHGQ